MPNHPSGHPSALGPVTAGVPKKLHKPRQPKNSVLVKPGVIESAEPSPVEFSFSLKPADIARYLNRFVIGQTESKKVLSVALCDHFQHVRMTVSVPRQGHLTVPLTKSVPAGTLATLVKDAAVHWRQLSKIS